MSWCQSHYKLRKISKWISNYAGEIETYSRNTCQSVSHSHATRNMNAAVSKWHKLAHQFWEIDFIQKVLMDVADSNKVIRRLLCSTVELKTAHWAHCRWKWQRLAVFRSSAECKKIKHLSKYWGVDNVNRGRPLQVKYWGSRPLQPLRRWRLWYWLKMTCKG